MTRTLKAIFAGFAAAVASLSLSIPASVIVAERLSPPVNRAQTPADGLLFQASFVEVNLVPPIVLAVLTFVVAFTWMQRRRGTKRVTPSGD
jgi:hypothetical protein